MNRMKKANAFTLIELLVVIAIIGILAGLISGAVGSAINNARVTNAAANARGLSLVFNALGLDRAAGRSLVGYPGDQLTGPNAITAVKPYLQVVINSELVSEGDMINLTSVGNVPKAISWSAWTSANNNAFRFKTVKSSDPGNTAMIMTKNLANTLPSTTTLTSEVFDQVGFVVARKDGSAGAYKKANLTGNSPDQQLTLGLDVTTVEPSRTPVELSD